MADPCLSQLVRSVVVFPDIAGSGYNLTNLPARLLPGARPMPPQPGVDIACADFNLNGLRGQWFGAGTHQFTPLVNSRRLAGRFEQRLSAKMTGRKRAGPD